METDKIQILLLDDNPNGLPRDHRWPDEKGGPPEMDVDFEELFEFRWLATPHEACEFRDLSWLIGHHDPQVLQADGWLPELLVIDYALTQVEGTVEQRFPGCEWLHQISPLPDLRRCANRLLKHPPTNRAPIDVGKPAGAEFWGCFIGGLMMTSFADHPCAPVTITRYNPQTLRDQAVDAAFFEWMMETQSGGQLRASGRSASPSWYDIIPSGTAALRERIRSLAKANIVQISIDDLTRLADHADHPVLTVGSRYGRRRYPVAGLFIDGNDDPSAWSSELLADLVPELDEFEAGVNLAKQIWNAYNDTGAQKRNFRLSELLQKERDHVLDADEIVELKGLKDESGYEASTDKRGRVSAKLTNPEWIAEIRMGEYSQRSRRWAALVLMQYLEHRLAAAVREATRRDQPGLHAISPHHAYFLLFPLAQTPAILPWHDPNKSPSDTWTDKMLHSQTGLKLEQLLTFSIEPWELNVLRSYFLRAK